MKAINNIAIFVIVSVILSLLITLLLVTKSAIGVLILTTLFSVISSIATLIQANELQHQREEGERPEIAVYMKVQNMLIYCVVENLGKLSARNIVIVFNPSPISHDGKSLQDFSLFANPIPYLPPNEIYRKHLGASASVLERNKQPFEITVQYSSTAGKAYKDTITIDLSILADANHPAPTVEEGLTTISNQLKQLTQRLDSEIRVTIHNDAEF